MPPAKTSVVRHERPGLPDEVLVEVEVVLEPDAWHEFAREALWAEPQPEGNVLIRSVPFFAFELAPEDVVKLDDAHRVGEVVSRGGSSVYRVLADQGLDRGGARERLEALEELDCFIERKDARLAAIEVPPQTDLEDVYEILAAGEEAGDWEFEEGHAATGEG